MSACCKNGYAYDDFEGAVVRCPVCNPDPDLKRSGKPSHSAVFDDFEGAVFATEGEDATL